MYARILGLRRDLRELLDQVRPGVILIEWTKGKVGKRHKGRGAGLAVYGAGLGAIATEAEHRAQDAGAQVIPILENNWTRGVPKAERSAAIAALYPAYRAAEDPGGDAADAVGLGRWWLRQNLIN